MAKAGLTGDGEEPEQEMTVLVTVAVTLKKPSEWTAAFGVEGRAAIRKDVKAYVGRALAGGEIFASGEVEAGVELR